MQHQRYFLSVDVSLGKLWEIICNHKIIRQIPIFIPIQFLNRFHGNAIPTVVFEASFFHRIFFPCSFLGKSKRAGSLVYNDQTIRLYPSLQRKLTQTERVSFLLFAALISLHLLRAVHDSISFHLRHSSSDHLLPFSNDSPSSPIFTLLSSYLSVSLLSSWAPTIPYRNLSCASSIFLRTVSLSLLQGNRPNADAAGVHPAKIARLSRQPIRAHTYVRTSGTFAIGNFVSSKSIKLGFHFDVVNE